MSLYLKYRPQDFSSVVGQDHAVTTIRNALIRNSLTHAYLFCGPRGTGKTSLARIIAKAINCLSLGEGANPCNACEICQAISKGRLVDLIEIDAASNRGIDEIRELREKIVFAPSQARAKVYIIDEVHMLTKEAFNALLKTLEEPPDHAYFILATTEAHKIPETIISRCQQFNFKRIGSPEIVGRLQEIASQEGVKADDDALSLIAKVSNGGLRDAIGLFEQMIGEGQISHDKVAENLGLSGSVHVERFFEALVDRKALKAIEVIQQVNAQGRSLSQFITELIGFLREQMLINIDRPTEVRRVMDFIDIFANAKQQLSQAVIPQLPLEMGVIRACDFEAGSAAEPSPKAQSTQAVHQPEVSKPAPTASAAESQKAPAQPSADSDAPPLALEEVKRKWQQVLDKVDTPFIRMSLMDGEPSSYESGTLTLKFNSSTLMQKVESPANQVSIVKAMESVFGTKILLKSEVKKVVLTPVTPKESSDTVKGPSVVDMAKEVFGVNQ